MAENLEARQLKPTIRGVADLVFCIDRSGSMTPFIEALKDNIKKFFDDLTNIEGIDISIGFIAQTGEEFLIKNFTKDMNDLKNKLELVTPLGNEFTLPALDWAADFFWDVSRKSNRIIVLITDEPLETGREPSYQRSKMDELAEKLNALGTYILYYGVACPEYREFVEKKLNRGFYNKIDFQSIMNTPIELIKVIELIKKTVSNVSKTNPGVQVKPAQNKNIYGLPIGGYPVIKNL